MKNKWANEEDLHPYEKFENIKFILFTNSPLKMEQYPKNQSKNSCDIFCKLENILKTGGHFFKISRKTHSFVYDVFDNLPKYIQVLKSESSSEDEILSVVRELLNKEAKTLPSRKELNKLLNDLENLGDLSDYEQFMSNFYFCIEQVPESRLDNLIKRELVILCGESRMYAEFLAGVQNWWQNSHYYLTEHIPFWKAILQDCVTKFSHTSELSLKFTETELDAVKTKITSDGNVWHFVSSCPSLSCLKVEQSLDIKLMIDVDTLKEKYQEILKLWLLGSWFNFLVVVENECISSFSEQLLAELTSTLLSKPQKNIIIISGPDSEIKLQLESRKLVVNVFEDDFNLAQLDLESQNSVLECDVMFQGHNLPLKCLGTTAALQTAVTAANVIEVLSGKLTVG
ncbi:hypothetical protein L9F63_006759 [Diploptera punctata]|uniref:Uncharacterized protein n=1 Tax=Diploptera punctata TaxID=6984 RepID=A0AAD8E3Z1_DIPPU|nr:hypothetical protein L9F63_006759 [Diploptera punctata]